MSRSTSRRARYHAMSRRVANEWRISWSRGPRPMRRGCPIGRRPTALHRLANVRRAACLPRRDPRCVTRNAGVSRRGRTVSRNVLYAASARRADSSSGTKRDLPNFDSRMVRMPLPRSTSPRSRRSASPGRRPVATRRPMSVLNVAPRSPDAERSWAVAAIRSAISPSV